MIEIDHDPDRSPCGIHLFTIPRATCPICPCPLSAQIVRDSRSSAPARERARERGQERARVDPAWGQTWTPTAIGARD